MSHNNITLVSGYWPVKNKHTHESYSQWFNNTLKINQRMYFFCDKERGNSQIAQHRKDYETIFVDHTIDKFPLSLVLQRRLVSSCAYTLY